MFGVLPFGYAPFAWQIPAASALTDNFEDNSTDPALWVIAPYDPANSTTGMVVAEANGRLELTGPALDATVRVNGYVAAGFWSMAGSAIFVRFDTVPQTNEIVLFGFEIDSANHLHAIIDANLRLHQEVAASGSVIAGPIAFSSTTHRWLRLRHDDTNGLIKLDTATSSASNPPIDSDWTERLSATAPGFSFTAVKPYLQNTTVGSIASPTTHIFDGFNTGANVSIAITGQSLSVAQGSVLQGAPVTGQNTTAAIGSAAPVVSIALTGQTLAGAAGTVSPASSFALTGGALTAARGTVTVASSANVTAALTGQSVVTGGGTVSPGTSIALTGQSVGTAQNTLVPVASLGITGQQATAAQGTFTFTATAALVGQEAAVSQFAKLLSETVPEPKFWNPPPLTGRRMSVGRSR